MGCEYRSDEFMLLDLYLSGDKAAGEKLFGSIFPAVIKYVFSQTKNDSYLNDHDKDDIVAEAMIRALEKQHLFNGSSRFATFVIGFAKKIILEVRKKSGKLMANVVPIEDAKPIEVIDIFNNPLFVVLEKERLEALYEAFSRLTEDQQTVLRLRLFNGLPFKQVAEMAGKSDEAVDSLFRRAMQSFKNNYEKIYFHPTDF